MVWCGMLIYGIFHYHNNSFGHYKTGTHAVGKLRFSTVFSPHRMGTSIKCCSDPKKKRIKWWTHSSPKNERSNV